MTDEELHKIAKKTAIYGIHSDGEWIYSFYIEPLQAFAKLIAEHERQECAKVCDAFQARDVGMQPAECAGAIRARKNNA